MTTPECPRVLLVTRNLPPLLGGMERLNWHMASELTAFAEVHIVGPAGSASGRPHRTEVREVPLAPLSRFLVSSLAQACKEARTWRPDIVLAGSGLTAPAALLAAKVCGARAVAYLHGLDVIASHPVYRLLWRPVLRRMSRLVANSDATASLCRGIGIKSGKIGVVRPGVQVSSTLPSDAQLERFRREHGVTGRRVLLSVGRLTERKGMREFVSHALPGIVARDPDVVLMIVGDAPADALHARGQSAASIAAAAASAGVSQHVRCVGRLSEADLQTAYALASLHVFPIRQLPGDPEGFGMVAIEAAACGVPTVAFDVGGVGDAVLPGRSGYLVPPADYTAFAEAVHRVLAGAVNPGDCVQFARRFEWSLFGQALVRELGLGRRSGCGGT